LAVLEHLLRCVLLLVVLVLQLVVLRLLLVLLVVELLQLRRRVRRQVLLLLQVVRVLRVPGLRREQVVREEDAEEDGLLDAELLLLLPQAAADVAVVVQPIAVAQLRGLVDLAGRAPELVLDAGELAAYPEELALGILGVHGHAQGRQGVDASSRGTRQDARGNAKACRGGCGGDPCSAGSSRRRRRRSTVARGQARPRSEAMPQAVSAPDKKSARGTRARGADEEKEGS